MTMIPVYARPPFLNMFAIAWSTFLASANKNGGLAPKQLEADIIAIEIME
jgi:protein Mpv17